MVVVVVITVVVVVRDESELQNSESRPRFLYSRPALFTGMLIIVTIIQGTITVKTIVCHIVLPLLIHSCILNRKVIERVHICSHVPLCSYLGITKYGMYLDCTHNF